MSFPSTTSCCPASTHDIITSFPRSLVICLRVLRHSVIMLSTTSWVVLKQKDHSNAVPLLHSFVLASMVSYVTFVLSLFITRHVSFGASRRKAVLRECGISWLSSLILLCLNTGELYQLFHIYVRYILCEAAKAKINVLGSLVCHICDSIKVKIAEVSGIMSVVYILHSPAYYMVIHSCISFHTHFVVSGFVTDCFNI